jgi:excisionase family DNA binding protein
MNATPSSFLPVKVVAHRLGVPAAWLRRQVEAGAIPAIRTGRRWLVDIDGARASLLARARAGAEADPATDECDPGVQR